MIDLIILLAIFLGAVIFLTSQAVDRLEFKSGTINHKGMHPKKHKQLQMTKDVPIDSY